mmetsp:Transcript_9900/g.30698  ORF Transcript_9900/g.30698 Transcript_9900/m.30698 type:complete len:194 (+) Transcript_9900:56-637(+)
MRVYTTLVVLADLLRHGSQYLALLSVLHALVLPGRSSAALVSAVRARAELPLAGLCCAGGLLLTIGNQLLLSRLLGNRRLSLGSLLYSGFRGPTGGALAVLTLLLALVALCDLWAFATRPDVASLLRLPTAAPPSSSAVAGAGSDAQEALAVVATGVSAAQVLLAVTLQASLRTSFVLGLRWAHHRRSGKVLP